jgi:RNase H-like domain found in reverse transcriptase
MQLEFFATGTKVLTGGLLAYYSAFKPTRLTRVETDASDGVTAGVLNQQQVDESWRPVAHCSKTIKTRQLVAEQYY